MMCPDVEQAESSGWAWPLLCRLRVPFTGFLAAGGLATGVHWGVMALVVSLTGQPAIATFVGSASGAAANYGLQRQLAFPNAGSHRQTFSRYLLSCVLAWGANLSFFILLNQIMQVTVIAAQLVTTAMVAAMNFVVYKRLVFNDKLS
ncbi:GtrA family protein [Microbulbifer sp. 2201CG32-9]|uniref:GtrA family protein n=1 Tax=Microbulbifer sp. 2201CG32-9 TaxID=3232309 RepID=UPI00345B58C0